MKNKVLFFATIFLMLFLVTGCGKSDAVKFKEEYESLNGTVSASGKEIRSITIDKDNPMIYKSADDIVKMIENKETFVVYFGFPACPWCRSVLPTLLDVSKDLGLDKIYYVDVLEIRDTLKVNDNKEVVVDKKGTDAYYKLLELKPKINKIKVPTLFIFSEDDPFSNPDWIPVKDIEKSKYVAFLTTKEGGHTGFCQGWDAKVSYSEEVSLDFCNTLKKMKE